MPTIETARTWYPANDAVHGFEHVLRVCGLAEQIAKAEGADLEIVSAAALLHDVDSSQFTQDGAGRVAHQHASADFAYHVLASEDWQPERIAAVQHCIRAHRFRDDREQPATLEAQVLYDADKLDAIGAVGVARAIGYAVQAGQPVYARPSSGFIENGLREPGEPHSAYHEYIFKLRKLAGSLYTHTGASMAAGRHHLMETFFQALAAEMDVP